MQAWIQKGFALISDISPAGKTMRKAQTNLLDHLKANIRIVEAELHFEA
jgi:hypothetical protein